MTRRRTWWARTAASCLTAALTLAGGMGASSALAAGSTAAAPDAVVAPITSPSPGVVTAPGQIAALRSQLRTGTLARTHGTAKVCADQKLTCLSQALTTRPGSKELLITGAPVGYGATELAKAYGLPGGTGTAGSGRTIAILGAGAYPNLESDLTIYRDTYGLPRCTTASGCLRIVDYRGGKPAPPSTDDFGSLVEEIDSTETALDVQMASAACPACKIVYAQLPWQDGAPATAADADVATAHFATASQTAVRLGAASISISYGYPVSRTNLTGAPAKNIAHRGVAVLAASGDLGFSGGQGLWPQSLPTVISAGGTALYTSSTGRGYTDVAWSGAGSGCTPGVGPANGQPKAVSTLCGGSRAASDVSAVADPATGVAVYNSYSPALGLPPGFLVVGGTSASSALPGRRGRPPGRAGLHAGPQPRLLRPEGRPERRDPRPERSSGSLREPRLRPQAVRLGHRVGRAHRARHPQREEHLRRRLSAGTARCGAGRQNPRRTVRDGAEGRQPSGRRSAGTGGVLAKSTPPRTAAAAASSRVVAMPQTSTTTPPTPAPRVIASW